VKELVHIVLWIVTSLATAITISIANILDSHVLSKKLQGLSPYLLTMAVFQAVTALIALAIFPFPAASRFADILAGIGGGLANAVALVILLNALQKGEVSRVIPVTSSFPIFVALLSMPLLGEMLSFTGWLTVLLTVAGAVLISLQLDGGGKKTKLHSSFLLLLFVALLFSVSNIAYKYAMTTISTWNTFTINGLCVATVALIYAARKKNILELKNLEQRNQKIGLIIGNQMIAALGIILSFIAIRSGPVALVSTIMNIRPAFILIFSLIISRFYPGFITEHIARKTIIIKIIGIAMITGGVAIIGLYG
jgi:drug/metabolite transporter (DMT)-like permease